MNYLNDWKFLKELFSYHMKEYLAYFTLLDFSTEKVLQTISGKIISGSGNITAKSPIRRTASLQLLFDYETGRIINKDNLIAIDKKISFSIGMINPFYGREDYSAWSEYGEIITFKMGIFFITSANASAALTGGTVSVNLTDKMGKLNGSPGGIFPATVALHEKIIFDENDDYSIEYPLISEIITECVNHFGGEPMDNIFIEDVPDMGRRVVIYNGDTPIWFNINEDNTGSFPCTAFQIRSDKPPTWPVNVGMKKQKGEIIGYLETPLTYPGELVKKSGNNVSQVLQDIGNTLGAFEFFYDVEGIFHFRRVRNYDIEAAPLISNLAHPSAYNDKLQSSYIPVYNKDIYLSEFASNTLVSNATFTPVYDNIKNDYICWGTRKDEDGNEMAVRYHMAIDEIPEDTREFITDSYGFKSVSSYGNNLCNKWIVAVRRNIPELDNDKMIIRYDIYRDQAGNILTPQTNPAWFKIVAGFPVPDPQGVPNVGEKYDEDIYCPALQDYFSDLLGQFDWREELYRRALMNFNNSTQGSDYDAELIAEWRLIYDPTSIDGIESFRELWNGYFSYEWTGYTPDVIIAPQRLRYWLDIIPSTAPIGRYGVNKIGRRTYTNENSKINQVYPENIIDVVFFEIPSSMDDPDGTKLREKQQEYMRIGQNFCQLKAEQMEMLTPINSFGTCYEDVRQAFLEHTLMSGGLTLQTEPIWYLDVNKLARYANKDLGINGYFLIETISWNISAQGTGQMNIQMSEGMSPLGEDFLVVDDLENLGWNDESMIFGSQPEVV